MFEVKKYAWLLSELTKQKANLRILDIYFLKLESIQSSFKTSADGLITTQGFKQISIKEALEKVFCKKLISIDNLELSKPVIYVRYPTYKKIISVNELRDLMKKEQKLHSVKEMILMQDYQHGYSQYYSVDLVFDGEGLITSIFRKDFIFPETSWKDSKYIHLAMNLSKYLVSFIETCTSKNILRLNYDFVIDPKFVPIILYINSIKLTYPKIIALNKGISTEALERHIPIKKDFRAQVFNLIPSLVKEPEPEATSPSPINSNLTTSIFKHFIKQFIEGKPRRKTVKQTMSEQMSPVPAMKIEKRASDDLKTYSNRNSHGRSTANPQEKLRLNLSLGESIKLPDVRVLGSPKLISHRSCLYDALKPTTFFSKFLKDEEERILERKSKRLACSKIAETSECKILKIKKKNLNKKGIKIRKKLNKHKTREKIASPYSSPQILKL